MGGGAVIFLEPVTKRESLSKGSMEELSRNSPTFPMTTQERPLWPQVPCKSVNTKHIYNIHIYANSFYKIYPAKEVKLSCKHMIAELPSV